MLEILNFTSSLMRSGCGSGDRIGCSLITSSSILLWQCRSFFHLNTFWAMCWTHGCINRIGFHALKWLPFCSNVSFSLRETHIWAFSAGWELETSSGWETLTLANFLPGSYSPECHENIFTFFNLFKFDWTQWLIYWIGCFIAVPLETNIGCFTLTK